MRRSVSGGCHTPSELSLLSLLSIDDRVELFNHDCSFPFPPLSAGRLFCLDRLDSVYPLRRYNPRRLFLHQRPHFLRVWLHPCER